MNRSSTLLGMTAALVAAALLTWHGVSAQTAPAAAPAPPGDAVRGKANFLSYGCYECHGTVGEGNYGTGAKIAPHPPPWAEVSAYVRKPAGDMPSFSVAILPDKDLADIYAYLQSIPEGKPYTQLPILNDTTMKAK